MAISLAELARAGEVLTGWHVDSVVGDDAADGSAAHPLKTIAGLLTKDIAAGDNIWLRRGSYWREMIRVEDLPDGCAVRAYGSGAAPMLDEADIVTGWSKTDGYTNVYQADVAMDFQGVSYPNSFLRVWEDGHTSAEMMAHVADLATLDSTPGAWAGLTTPEAATVTIYVHASDSGDPAANGSVYECATRPYGVKSGQYSTDAKHLRLIDGISTRRHAHHDGGILSATLVRNCTVDRGGQVSVGAASEPAHGMWINGTAEDCTSSSFISYGTDVPSVKFLRCTGVGGSWFFHTGAVGLYKFKRYWLEDCEAQNATTFASGDAAELVVIIRPRFVNTPQGVTFFNADQFYWVGGTFVELSELGNVAYFDNVGEATLFGVRMVVKQRANYASVAAHTGCGKLTVIGSTLVFTDPEVAVGYRSGFAAIGAATELVAQHNLLRNSTQAVAALGPCDADYNVYDSVATPWYDDGVSYATFAAWQAAGQDAHSVVEDTAFAGDVTTGNTEPAEGAAAWTVEAGADAYGDAHLAEVIASLP